ncbi:MAG: hypothetical protein GEU93_05000 [Propionibacteriales bacterium]|nr:hypothetical protein [Propionibacteriales bacterium]
MFAARSALVAALCVIVVGCENSPPVGDPPPESPWAAGFEQDRPDQDTPYADVRLTNLGRTEVTVEGVRLRWSGYPERRWQPADMTYGGGHTHRLDIRLPRPACDDNPAEPPGVQVRLVDGSTATVELDAPGAKLLRLIWDRQCGEQRLLDAVGVDFEGWQEVRQGGGPAMRVHLTGERRDTDAEVTLTETRGSVLLDLEPAGRDRVLLSRSAARGRIPVVVTPIGRCEAHALADSSHTFDFRVWLSLDGGPEQSLVMRPDTRARLRLEKVITDDCDTG